MKLKMTKLFEVLSVLIEVLSVLSVILNSGGNSKVRGIGWLVIITILLLLSKKKIKKPNMVIAVLMMLYFTLNACVINRATLDGKEFVVLLARVVCCSIIASNIEIDAFFRIYIKIMVFLCCVSLFWFGLLQFDIYPPFVSKDSGVYSSIFHTIGFKLSTRRNSGVFSEPGLFQIHINLAFITLNYYRDRIFKKQQWIIILFIITVLTTKSAMGYGCLFISCVTYFISNDNLSKFFGKREKRDALIFFLGVCAVAFELHFHVVEQFVTSWGSYTSRHDDTLLGLLIAKDYPIFGIGVANSNDEIWRSYFSVLGSLSLYEDGTGSLNDLASSNGLMNCMYQAGIPFTIVYTYSIINTFIKKFSVDGISEKIAIVLYFLMVFFGEPYMLTPIFLIFIFYSKKSEELTNRLLVSDRLLEDS